MDKAIKQIEHKNKQIIWLKLKLEIEKIKRGDPEFIIYQYGVDCYYKEPLGGLSLSTNTYEEVARMIHGLANRYLNRNLSILVGG